MVPPPGAERCCTRYRWRELNDKAMKGVLPPQSSPMKSFATEAERIVLAFVDLYDEYRLKAAHSPPAKSEEVLQCCCLNAAH